jgi:hypothetical protein
MTLIYPKTVRSPAQLRIIRIWTQYTALNSAPFGFLLATTLTAQTGHQPATLHVERLVHYHPLMKTTPAKGIALVAGGWPGSSREFDDLSH